MEHRDLFFFKNLNAPSKKLQEAHHPVWQCFLLLLAARQARFLRHTNAAAHCFSTTLLRFFEA